MPKELEEPDDFIEKLKAQYRAESSKKATPATVTKNIKTTTQYEPVRESRLSNESLNMSSKIETKKMEILSNSKLNPSIVRGEKASTDSRLS